MTRPHRRHRATALTALVVLVCALLPACRWAFTKIAQAIHEVMRDPETGMVKGEGGTLAGKHEGNWTFYYADGRKRSSGLYRDNLQAGPWMAWYENGRPEWIGYYGARGGRSDLWTYFHDNGELRARGRYQEDFELGRWEFFDRQGQRTRAGEFEAARQVGWWTIRDIEGTSSGLLLDGNRVGPWTTVASDGSATTHDHAIPDDYVLAREMWPDGGLRRTGLMRDGKPVSGWASFFANGTQRASCVFGDDAARSFAVFDDEGTLFAEGLLTGKDLTSWQLASKMEAAASTPMPAPSGDIQRPGQQHRGNQNEAEDSGPVPPPPGQLRETMPPLPPDVELWQTEAPRETAALVALRLEELRSPVPQDAIVSPPAATEVEPATPVESPRIHATKQPEWTVIEQKEIKDHVQDYLEKKPRAKPLSDRYQVDPGRVGKERRRKDLEGNLLPLDQMAATDGSVVKFADFRGKKRVLLVVLRGFFGHVCVYCVAQTEALAMCAERFDALNLEVLILYPGPKGNEESFLAAYRETFGKGAPPYRVFYDPDLAITKQLGIEGGDLAYPTMIYIDESGTVQYAYTGAHRADRPAANELIRFIEDLDEKKQK